MTAEEARAALTPQQVDGKSTNDSIQKLMNINEYVPIKIIFQTFKQPSTSLTPMVVEKSQPVNC